MSFPLSLDAMRQPPYAFTRSVARHHWRLNAAVKAIAFCPWQPGLVAIGGGSNDRRIHFYHAMSGVCLARIDCGAQVTSLIWAETRREIVATFGFAQPEHKIRIAVYSWPDCAQVCAIPWTKGDYRALCAVRFPGSLRRRREDDASGWLPRTYEEGSLAIATSDHGIAFHEVWPGRPKWPLMPRRMGSAILDHLNGIEPEDGDCIR